MFELKLLARFDSASVQQSFCALWEKQSSKTDASVSKVFIISPPLPAFAKDKIRDGKVVNLHSDIFHGLSNGVNGVNPVLKGVSLSVVRVIYAQDFGLNLRSTTLTYILHSASTSTTSAADHTNSNNRAQVLSHQIAAPPDFDHLLYGRVRLVNALKKGAQIVPPGE
jgi:hypothetical protein